MEELKSECMLLSTVEPTVLKFMAELLIRLTDLSLCALLHVVCIALQDLQWFVSHPEISMGLDTTSFPVTAQPPWFPEFKTHSLK